MRKIWILAGAVLGFGAVAVAAQEPGSRPGADRLTSPSVPPASGTSSSDLGRSGGVITPPADVDPAMKQTPPACLEWLPIAFPLAEGPRVRIRLPPAESLSLAPSRSRTWRTPAFRAGVRGSLGVQVGRDAHGVLISRQPAAISLPGHIPVPQCR
jgi:hypothetical protein